jgi:predicted HTH domain antitoxin
MRLKASVMSSVKVEIEEPLAALLHQTNQPVQAAAREMIVLELYRRGTISSGKAAELLGMERIDFIKHASRLGIPFFDMTEDEWEAEKAALKNL